MHDCSSIDTIDTARDTVRKLKILLSVPSGSDPFLGSDDRREPANKNAPKQARFFSAKKKRATKDESKTLTKPSKQARLTYQRALLNVPESSGDELEIPNINSSDAAMDHRY